MEWAVFPKGEWKRRISLRKNSRICPRKLDVGCRMIEKTEGENELCIAQDEILEAAAFFIGSC